MLATLARQFLEECRDLDVLVSSLDESDWHRPTAFFDWTVRDEIMHLHQVDGFAVAALESAARFGAVLAEARSAQAAGVTLSEQARARFGDLPAAKLLARWRETYASLAGMLAGRDAKARLSWFGPDMSPTSMASARQMEVWAHGQDIYDLLDLARPTADRIRNICELGVRTFAWSFRNRGRVAPPRPDVILTGPRGDLWEWPGEGGGRVRGTALDFALVVTQRRAPSDTALVAEGAGALAWLPLAQCFAGAPQEPAAPGSRPRMRTAPATC